MKCKRLRVFLILVGLMLLMVGVVRAAQPPWPGARWYNLSYSEYVAYGSIALDMGSDGEVGVAWENTDVGGIYWTHSQDNSPDAYDDWTTPISLTLGMESWAPDVVYSGTMPYLSWVSGDPRSIYEQAVDDVGIGTPRPVVTDVYNARLQLLPDMELGDEGFHMVFSASNQQYADNDLYYAYRPFGSDSWTTTVAITSTQVVSTSIGTIWRPRLAVDGSTIHIIWHQEEWEGATFVDSVWYVSGVQTGGSVVWDTPVRLSPDGQTARSPDIATDGAGRVHAVWAEHLFTDRLRQYVNYTRDDGGGWAPAIRLDSEPVVLNQDSPSWLISRVAARGDDVAVMWHAYYEDWSIEKEELLARLSEDGGATWDLVLNATDTPDTISISPNLVWGLGRELHFIGAEYMSIGNLDSFDLFYGRGSLDATFVFLPIVVRGY